MNCMLNFIRRYFLLFIILLLLSSCAKQGTSYVNQNNNKKIVPTVKKVAKKYTPPIAIKSIIKIQKKIKIDKVLQKLFNKQIIIKTKNKVKLKKYKDLIKTAYSFLYKNFGKPKYTKKIEIIIHKKSIKHPTATWTKNTKEIRKVNFSDFYMFETALPTIVHELFHALYQTNDFIFSNTEFILEGSATYVEKMYKYKNDDKKIKEMFLKDIKLNHICKAFSKKYNFNNPFKLQDRRKIYYLYILSGSFFAIQNNIKGKDLIIKLLNGKSKKVQSKKSIDKKLISIFSQVLKLNKPNKKSIEKIIKKYKLNPIKNKIGINYFCKGN